jgi:type IV secretory pathway TrbD component
MTFLIGSVAVVLLLALVNWVACFFGCDVAGVAGASEPPAAHGGDGSHAATGARSTGYGSH